MNSPPSSHPSPPAPSHLTRTSELLLKFQAAGKIVAKCDVGAETEARDLDLESRNTNPPPPPQQPTQPPLPQLHRLQKTRQGPAENLAEENVKRNELDQPVPSKSPHHREP